MGIKDVKINFIVGVATELFLAKGINNVTIKDIAEAAEVGEATIYRSFAKKQNIAIASAKKLAGEALSKYSKVKGKNGFEKISALYSTFLTIFKHDRHFYSFINEFDAYVVAENSDLSDYEESILPFYKVFLDIYEEGLSDGSIKAVDDIRMFYFASTHAIMGLCKKLASEKNILKQDRNINSIDEIKTLIDVILYRLKPTV